MNTVQRHLFFNHAVTNVNQVSKETIFNCIQLYKDMNDNGKLEDINVVVVDCNNATAKDLVTIDERIGKDLKCVGLEVDAQGRVVIVSYYGGDIHQQFSAVFRFQIWKYIKTEIKDHLFCCGNVTTERHLNGRAPDIIVKAMTDGHIRLVVEIEHQNMSVPMIRARGMDLFELGNPHLRVVVLVKVEDMPQDNYSAVAVCYIKNAADDVIHVHDAVSFGSVDSDTLDCWTSRDHLLPAVTVPMRVCVYPRDAAVMTIPLDSLFYRIPIARGDHTNFLATPAGIPDLQLDLCECLFEAIRCCYGLGPPAHLVLDY